MRTPTRNRSPLLPALATLAAIGAGETTRAAQDGSTVLPDAVMDEVSALLPKRDNASASFLSDAYTPILEFSGPAQVEVVLVFESTSFHDTLGYFTYSEDAQGAVTVLSSNLVIPDVTMNGAGLARGDTFVLRDASGAVRTFVPGEKLGFFLVADGWRSEPAVPSWDPFALLIPSNDGAVNEDFGRGCFTSLRRLNPEFAAGRPDVAAHLALVAHTGIPGFLDGDAFLIGGFENLNRLGRSDDDFNDLLFLVRGVPATAVDTSNVAQLGGASVDSDADGVLDADDSYPNDPTRAIVTRFPKTGDHVLALEDLYPVLGDADYNDAVIAFHFDLVKDAQGRVKDLMGTFALVGRGAGIDHRFGIHLPGLPAGTGGTWAVERFLSDDAETEEATGVLALADLIGAEQRRITLFPTTRHALPLTTSDFATNTDTATVERPAALARFLCSFDTAVDEAVLGTPPYDPYFHLFRGPQPFDVHMPGFEGFADRPATAPPESGPEAFLDDQGYPWLVHLPTEWRWPIEHQKIWVSYPPFNAWVASGGATNVDWYEFPHGSWVSLDLSLYMRQVEFGLQLPGQ